MSLADFEAGFLAVFAVGKDFEVFLILPDREQVVSFAKQEFAIVKEIVLGCFGPGRRRTCLGRRFFRHNFRPGSGAVRRRNLRTTGWCRIVLDNLGTRRRRLAHHRKQRSHEGRSHQEGGAPTAGGDREFHGSEQGGKEAKPTAAGGHWQELNGGAAASGKSYGCSAGAGEREAKET